MYRAPAVLMISSLLLIGCSSDNSKVKTDPLPQQDFLVASPPPPPAESLGNAQRFIASNDVPGAALDTMTGRLCKTYAWEDDQRRPQGLPLCSDLTTRSVQTGDRRAFLGYEYTFDGKSWIRGNTTRSYDPKTGTFSPKSDDPFDPLGILTNAEKRRRRLSRDQIQAVANQFHVTVAEVVRFAEAAGYLVEK
jgi:hypothetical protein